MKCNLPPLSIPLISLWLFTLIYFPTSNLEKNIASGQGLMGGIEELGKDIGCILASGQIGGEGNDECEPPKGPRPCKPPQVFSSSGICVPNPCKGDDAGKVLNLEDRCIEDPCKGQEGKIYYPASNSCVPQECPPGSDRDNNGICYSKPHGAPDDDKSTDDTTSNGGSSTTGDGGPTDSTDGLPDGPTPSTNKTSPDQTGPDARLEVIIPNMTNILPRPNVTTNNTTTGLHNTTTIEQTSPENVQSGLQINIPTITQNNTDSGQIETEQFGLDGPTSDRLESTSTSSQSSSSGETTPIETETNRLISLENTSDFQSAKEQYLSIWDQTDFQSSFDTFIIPGSNNGFGIYEVHTSNVFRPGETLELYIQPVGYTHEPITDAMGNTLYFINLTADIIITDPQGNQLAPVYSLPPFELASHERNTEFLILLTLDQANPFPEAEYKIKYIVTDEPSKESFEIVRDVTISNTG